MFFVADGKFHFIHLRKKVLRQHMYVQDEVQKHIIRNKAEKPMDNVLGTFRAFGGLGSHFWMFYHFLTLA